MRTAHAPTRRAMFPGAPCEVPGRALRVPGHAARVHRVFVAPGGRRLECSRKCSLAGPRHMPEGDLGVAWDSTVAGALCRGRAARAKAFTADIVVNNPVTCLKGEGRDKSDVRRFRARSPLTR